MIIPEFYKKRDDGIDLYQRKSTLNVKLLQVETGAMYDDPIDIDPCPYTYKETNIPIDGKPTPIDEETEQKAEAYDYLTGRTESEVESNE